MGMFSWHTTDDRTVIWIDGFRNKTKTVYMIDNKGNEWVEKNYKGYGRFGGKDYYELVAEMNEVATGDLEKDRLIGIELELNEDNHPDSIFPNLVRKPNKKWRNVKPMTHDGQGFSRGGN